MQHMKRQQGTLGIARFYCFFPYQPIYVARGAAEGAAGGLTCLIAMGLKDFLDKCHPLHTRLVAELNESTD